MGRISLKPLVSSLRRLTADKPETTGAFPVSQEIVVESNPNLTTNPNSPPHNKVEWENLTTLK